MVGGYLNGPIDEAWLRDMYYGRGKSLSEVALCLGKSETHVRYWMKQYEMKRRNKSEATKLMWSQRHDEIVEKRRAA
jgi:transposase